MRIHWPQEPPQFITALSGATCSFAGVACSAPCTRQAAAPTTAPMLVLLQAMALFMSVFSSGALIL